MFISLEGIDGSGKSTQAHLLADHLRAAGREIVLTREPGGSPGAEEIRRLLVEGRGERWSPQAELLLFNAARRDHLERTIRPALARGAVVVTDRFADSSRVYQGAARGELRALVDALHALVIGVEPDLTLVIDLDPAEALARTSMRQAAMLATAAVVAPGVRGAAHAVATAASAPGSGDAEDRFESMGLPFQLALRDGFRTLAFEFPARVRLIDGSGDPDIVAARVRAALPAALR
ncbi:dTMP kinase [Paracoccus luteus]|uniref:dTMP kinase n=1 Tax=Paracoccus luteus TaxID=2508543 RepID=UPI00107004E9|nr:dTMP kinase [Paracoccus luteus]